MSTLLIWVFCCLVILWFSGSLYFGALCFGFDFGNTSVFDFWYGNKVFSSLHSVIVCLVLISLRNKVGPVGNRHVKITSHVISMLRIHD